MFNSPTSAASLTVAAHLLFNSIHPSVTHASAAFARNDLRTRQLMDKGAFYQHIPVVVSYEIPRVTGKHKYGTFPTSFITLNTRLYIVFDADHCRFYISCPIRNPSRALILPRELPLPNHLSWTCRPIPHQHVPLSTLARCMHNLFITLFIRDAANTSSSSNFLTSFTARIH